MIVFGGCVGGFFPNIKKKNACVWDIQWILREIKRWCRLLMATRRGLYPVTNGEGNGRVFVLVLYFLICYFYGFYIS